MNSLLKHHYILGLGLVIGIFLATLTIVEKNNLSDQNWAAKIEDRIIPFERYKMQLEGLANDKRSPLTKKDKEYVLERMIEEELLIKRAIDLGMLENNPMARGTIVQQMIKNIISEGSRIEPEEKDIIKFFEENIGFFTKANRLRVRQIYFSQDDFGDKAHQEAKNAFTRLLKGETFDQVILSGSNSALKVPDTLMNLSITEILIICKIFILTLLLEAKIIFIYFFESHKFLKLRQRFLRLICESHRLLANYIS